MRRLMAFVQRHLTPADRLAETLCGLIMVLTFTLVAARHIGEGREAARKLLLATIGCNFAWGVIDGALYVLSAMAQRGRRARLGREVRRAPDEANAVAAVRAALDPELEAMVPLKDRENLYHAIVPVISQASPQRTRVTRDDLLGGVAILALEVVCTIPASLPFLIMGGHPYSLRVSNALLLLLLFAVGYRWGKEAEGRPLAAGLAMLLLGSMLVAVAIALGG
jgi:hypothetical protein